MAKTLVEKVTSTNPDVSVFKISGTLGYHENKVLEKFFRECANKSIAKLVMDFSELSSLGGGCAKIIREAAQGGSVVVCVAGASSRVRSVLVGKGDTPVLFEPDLEKALEKIESAAAPAARPDGAGTTRVAQKGKAEEKAEKAPAGGKKKGAPSKAATPARKTAAAGSIQKEETGKKGAGRAAAADRKGPGGEHLHKKLVQYRSLLSLNTDLNRIPDKSGLLDAFLLTTIAQVGVETAAFLERTGDEYVAASWKGFETADPGSLKIAASEVDVPKWLKTRGVFDLDQAPIRAGGRKLLEKWGMPYAAPFVVYEELAAIVLIGKPIRKELDENSWDFLSMLINQAAIAYANSSRFEAESKRTLGLVHSLISMIEENTMSRGHTEEMVNYIHALAVSVHYPEENLRDLIYGTVLRDIGMIKVSDLIVRSPRELMQEEWEIIKQHPVEGSQMLESMKFSRHTCEIVLAHHERFNGEGYPGGLQGPQIPLGARIVSVVESYAAMLEDRPTRPSLSREEALNTLKENWGNRYDPEIVDKFVDIVEDEVRSGEPTRYRGSELFKV
ncbi:MAG: HD domain-containing phosphohydrolase [Candidatus Krumholzibacteriia bacterium]